MEIAKFVWKRKGNERIKPTTVDLKRCIRTALADTSILFFPVQLNIVFELMHTQRGNERKFSPRLHNEPPTTFSFLIDTDWKIVYETYSEWIEMNWTESNAWNPNEMLSSFSLKFRCKQLWLPKAAWKRRTPSPWATGWTHQLLVYPIHNTIPIPFILIYVRVPRYTRTDKPIHLLVRLKVLARLIVMQRMASEHFIYIYITTITLII